MRILILLLICVSVQTSWGETNEELSLTLNKIQDDIKGLALETSLQLPEEAEPEPSPDEPANGCMTVDAVCVPMQNCTAAVVSKASISKQ
ncbi:unnamed protein product [Cyprideis torosa]|uniref:Uncharacterized protein n=1 Tax=Cyprideis torosa TaxID=163714 RepID=A0A7R8ZK76_9CRUS|nr:unnamed protein product [Cyprideis torosa]CAG0888716.1 unnamed protein product [Cyprideis torosa]